MRDLPVPSPSVPPTGSGSTNVDGSLRSCMSPDSSKQDSNEQEQNKHEESWRRRRPVLFWWCLAIGICIMVLIPALVCGLYFGLGRVRSVQSISRDPRTVNLGYSSYHGIQTDDGISQWLGIRYAQVPVKDLRFRAPQDPVVDGVVWQADQRKPPCHFSPSSSLDTTHSEDCLFLNVFAPTDTNGTLHPVYVFFQGGGFNALASPDLDGNKLITAADHDLVIVTFNYRVGLHGFLASREVQADGDLNTGLLDQRKVLHWVQKYIHLFGGDPKHVTIGGASAGGASVDLHLSAYGGRNDNLFHAAAAESQSFGQQLTVSESQYQYDALVHRVGCNTTADTLRCLRETDIQVLADNNPDMPFPNGPGYNPVFMWSSVIDGTFTTDYTYNLFATGKYVKVPSIFGDTTNEGTIFTPPQLNTTLDVLTFLSDNFPKLTAAHHREIEVLYPMAEQYPGKGAYWKTGATAYGEMRYICPGIFLSASIASTETPSWNYRWDVLSTDNAKSGLGVPHAVESASIWGSSGAPDNVLTPLIQAYWTSFIRTYNPNTHKLDSAPTWETFGSGLVDGNGSRLHIPNQPELVSMGHPPPEQITRCVYLSGIGASIAQ
ncbi:triacylglycerol lipase-like protein [Diplocarpon rosae]|nr:triacylglycerol lipase-like protein [Diplocarpon rosae]